MADFALVALPGAYHTSIGALSDCYRLARDRVEQVFNAVPTLPMETRLRHLSLDGGPVVMADGSSFACNTAISSAAVGDPPFAFIWLPAFRAEGPDQLTGRLSRSRPLMEWLVRQQAKGALIGASGAAVTLLMAAGLTSQIAVPVARALQPLVRDLFPRQKIEDRLGLVETGSLLLSTGIAADLRLILRAMERTISPEVARWVGSITGNDADPGDLLVDDTLVARAQLWIETHFTGPINLAELAAALSSSTATLNRRFRKELGVSPKGYMQRLRLDAAIRMLEQTRRPIDRIAELVGYADSRQFRAMFHQQTGMTASAWRAWAADAKAGGKTGPGATAEGARGV